MTVTRKTQNHKTVDILYCYDAQCSWIWLITIRGFYFFHFLILPEVNWLFPRTFLLELTLSWFPHSVLCPACQLWTRRPVVDWASWPSLTTCGLPSLLSSLASCWCWSFTLGRAQRKTTTMPVQVPLWHRQTPCWIWSGSSPQASLVHKDNVNEQRNTSIRGLTFINCSRSSVISGDDFYAI